MLGTQKSPTPFDIGLVLSAVRRLRLAGCRKRPSRLRVQSGLSCRGCGRSGRRRCGGSGCFRGFLRSRLLGCFLGGWLFGSRFLGGSGLFCRRFFRGCFLGGSSFLRCYLFRCYLFRWSLFRCCFFSRGRLLRRRFLRRYFFGWRSFFSWRSFLRWCGLFCGRFFCSCHHFLLDQITKSTSCVLECTKRFMPLG